MQIQNAIIVVVLFLAIFASVALVGNVAQKAQDGVSKTVPGFVPSTGQINNATADSSPR
jgi:hypothetical protein